MLINEFFSFNSVVILLLQSLEKAINQTIEEQTVAKAKSSEPKSLSVVKTPPASTPAKSSVSSQTVPEGNSIVVIKPTIMFLVSSISHPLIGEFQEVVFVCRMMFG